MSNEVRNFKQSNYSWLSDTFYYSDWGEGHERRMAELHIPLSMRPRPYTENETQATVVLIASIVLGSALYGFSTIVDTEDRYLENARTEIRDPISRLGFDYTGRTIGSLTSIEACLAGSNWDAFNSNIRGGKASVETVLSEGGESMITVYPGVNSEETRVLRLSGMNTFDEPLQPLNQISSGILFERGCNTED